MILVLSVILVNTTSPVAPCRTSSDYHCPRLLDGSKRYAINLSLQAKLNVKPETGILQRPSIICRSRWVELYGRKGGFIQYVDKNLVTLQLIPILVITCRLHAFFNLNLVLSF